MKCFMAHRQTAASGVTSLNTPLPAKQYLQNSKARHNTICRMRATAVLTKAVAVGRPVLQVVVLVVQQQCPARHLGVLSTVLAPLCTAVHIHTHIFEHSLACYRGSMSAERSWPLSIAYPATSGDLDLTKLFSKHRDRGQQAAHYRAPRSESVESRWYT